MILAIDGAVYSKDGKVANTEDSPGPEPAIMIMIRFYYAF
jgi:hypothetical protein